MDILRSYADLPASAKGAVVALGNFDGVHRGHQAVIAAARSLATDMGAPLAAMVFDPHPRRIFRPDDPPFLLTSLDTKCRLLGALGVSTVFALPFDEALRSLTAQQFVLDVLVTGLAAVHVVAGPDFRFGKGRGGDMAVLSYMGEAEGFGVTAVGPVGDENLGAGEQISSTAIRAALKAGEPEEAARLLGRPWAIEGLIITGDQRGRTIGFPTANLRLGDLIEPQLGVYAVTMTLSDGPQAGRYTGVANLGRRPTFDKTDVLLETHLFDFGGDLYGRQVSVDLLAFLRPERKFDGLEDLKRQIARDSEAARAIHAARGTV